MTTPAARTARPPAIILGLSGAAMGVLRSLDRLGVDCYGVYANPSAEVARQSRLLRGRFRVSSFGTDEEIMRVLCAIRERAGNPPKMALIPAGNDPLARFVSTHRDKLRDDFLIRVPPPGIGECFLDKRATVDICRRHGMAIPESFVPDTFDDVEQAATRARFPVIIKPARHDVPSFPGKNVVVADADELIAFYRERPELVFHSMFQEVVPSGDGHIRTVASFSDASGAVVARASSRKLRQWPPDTGVGCFSVTETHPLLLRLTKDFLEEVGYVGFSSIEFAEDAETGKCVFLELNARVVYRNQQYADAGVDLTAIGYLEMCGEGLLPPVKQLDGVYWLDFHRDIASFIVKRRRHTITFTGWLQSLRLVSSHSIFDLRDLKPFIASFGRIWALLRERRS